jgi:hypothetical protein
MKPICASITLNPVNDLNNLPIDYRFIEEEQLAKRLAHTIVAKPVALHIRTHYSNTCFVKPRTALVTHYP